MRATNQNGAYQIKNILFESIFQFSEQSWRNEVIESEYQLWQVKLGKSQLLDGEKKQQSDCLVGLQITKQHLLQMDLETKEIVSFIKFDYSHRFQIVRFQSEIQGQFGPIKHVKLVLFNLNHKQIFLTSKDQDFASLNGFAAALSKKYMVQIGFENRFLPIKKLGRGSQACVFSAYDIINKRNVAIKSFKRCTNKHHKVNKVKNSFKKQFEILTEVKHPNICELFTVFQTQNSTYMIFQLLPTTLLSFLQKSINLPQDKIKDIMIGLLQAVKVIHGQGIVHRDLKLQNIMIKVSADTPNKIQPVIVDFGLAEYIQNQKYCFAKCGTPGYVAPQIFEYDQQLNSDVANEKTNQNQRYSRTSCDMFSLGVIFYMLLFKKPLFEGFHQQEMLKKNQECRIDFESIQFLNLEQNCRDLLIKMLWRDPSQRISAEQALSHSFFNQKQQKQDNLPTTSCLQNNQK